VPLVEDKVITQPFGDRSKVVIEPMLTDQWFVDTDKIVGPALEAVRSGEIRIIPESGEKTYYHWLENIEPWTISRQLWWGHQIPVWYGPALEEVDGRQVLDFDAGKLVHFCAPNAEAARAKAAAYYGVAGPEAISLVRATDREARGVEPDDPLTRAAGATLRRDFDGEAFLPIWRDADVLDTWFSSGLWPMGTLGWPEDTDAFRRYFPDRCPDHGLRHHLLLGRPDDHDAKGGGRRMAVSHCLPAPARPGREGQEDVEDDRQCARPAGADRRIRRRRGAVHECLHCVDWRGPEAVEGPHPGLPQLRHETVERRALRRDERLQTGRRLRSGRRDPNREPLDRGRDGAGPHGP
jgi:hypothetical protein